MHRVDTVGWSNTKVGTAHQNVRAMHRPVGKLGGYNPIRVQKWYKMVELGY